MTPIGDISDDDDFEDYKIWTIIISVVLMIKNAVLNWCSTIAISEIGIGWVGSLSGAMFRANNNNNNYNKKMSGWILERYVLF